MKPLGLARWVVMFSGAVAVLVGGVAWAYFGRPHLFVLAVVWQVIVGIYLTLKGYDLSGDGG